MTHIHVTRESSDCDGSYTNEYTRPGDLWSAGVHSLLELTSYGTGYFNLTPFEDGDETRYRLRAGAPTDEGGWEIEVIECDNACDPDASSYRDHRAEEAGY